MLKIISMPLLVTLGLFGAMVGVLAGTILIYPGGYPDPFAPYDAIMPGQPIAALDDYSWCDPKHRSLAYNSITICPPFEIVVAKFDSDTIQSVWFHTETLQVVDLVRHWGTPDSVHGEPERFTLCWRKQKVFATTKSIARFTYQAPVSTVLVGSGIVC
jgi:hypothetical protein